MDILVAECYQCTTTDLIMLIKLDTSTNKNSNTCFKDTSIILNSNTMKVSSHQSSVLEEIGTNDDLTEINIRTDARCGWHKNAKDSSVVAIGEKINKVLKSVSQHHEQLGTQRIYQFLEEQDVQVNVHFHDRNLSINKLTAGPKFLKEKFWSAQLVDKVESVATHFHLAVRNCEENQKECKDVLLNIVEHYENNHQKCHPDSRCKRDTNYEPKRIVLSIPIAEKLLLDVIWKSTIYTHSEDYVLAKDTYWFNRGRSRHKYDNSSYSYGPCEICGRLNLTGHTCVEA
ncbi:unnamed protein product [Mytilus coruscus]|uniref:Uncharacterized protein n=1 Tax=Mytilus coruscus TaxID=42192 RepID=A0A6J8CYJ9_MYTCO|nr:unnamed protein product [Mytilus coruscus]